jgi:hypothetical protein
VLGGALNVIDAPFESAVPLIALKVSQIGTLVASTVNAVAELAVTNIGTGEPGPTPF